MGTCRLAADGRCERCAPLGQCLRATVRVVVQLGNQAHERGCIWCVLDRLALQHVLEVAGLLAGQDVVDDDRDAAAKRLGQGQAAGLGHQDVGRAHELGDVVDEAHREQRRTRLQLLDVPPQRRVAATDDQHLEISIELRESLDVLERARRAFSADHCQQRETSRVKAELGERALPNCCAVNIGSEGVSHGNTQHLD